MASAHAHALKMQFRILCVYVLAVLTLGPRQSAQGREVDPCSTLLDTCHQEDGSADDHIAKHEVGCSSIESKLGLVNTDTMLLCPTTCITAEILQLQGKVSAPATA